MTKRQNVITRRRLPLVLGAGRHAGNRRRTPPEVMTSEPCSSATEDLCLVHKPGTP